MIPLEIRIQNFLDSVSFIADERRQRAMWIEGDPGKSFKISLGELYAQFFDDNDIDNFINDELDASPLPLEQRKAIRAFRDALNRFGKAPGKRNAGNDSELIGDPEWNELVDLAKSTLVTFELSALR